jgi:hypothetical protein
MSKEQNELGLELVTDCEVRVSNVSKEQNELGLELVTDRKERLSNVSKEQRAKRAWSQACHRP